MRGQTVMMVASNGMGGMLGGLLAGWTLDMGGANWMLAACIACGCAGAALQIIGVVQVSLTSLKIAVAGYQFRSAEEEILFFKVSKPQISGLLMFYVRLYQIEKNRIDKSLSSQCRYLCKNLRGAFRHI